MHQTSVQEAVRSWRSTPQQTYQNLVAEINREVVKQFPDTKRFAALDAERQDQVLRAVEKAQGFGLFRFLTLAGMFANPSYGGNRERAGWKLLGFEDAGAFVPPFGYYDRGHHGDRGGNQ